MAFASLAAAQKNFTIQDAITGAGSYLAPERIGGLNWVPESHTWIHDSEKGKEDCMVFTDADKNTRDTLSLSDLNRALTIFNNTVNQGNPLEAFKSMPRIHSWPNKRQFRFFKDKLIYRFDITTRTLMVEHQYDKEASNLEIHEESGNLAYTIDNNLWIKTFGRQAEAITSEENKGIVYGQSVHRNEFGISKGIFWAPEGDKLAYYRMDETMVTEYPIYVLSDRPASARNIRYPFAGTKSHHVTLHVYSVKSKKSIAIKSEGPEEQYLTNIAWSPDAEKIYIAIVNRDQNEMKLVQFDAESGKQEKVLFTEKHEKYVEPEHPMTWLNKKEFIWQSERDGYNHLYLYSSKGELKKQLTKGEWMVTDFIGADEREKNLYFMSTKQSPLNKNLYKVNIKSGDITELTKANGVHYCTSSTDKELWLDNYSAPEVPNALQLVNNAGLTKSKIHTASNPLEFYNMGEIEVVKLKSTDGTTDLYGRLIKPVNFDSTKKYPVVVYVYGGPHIQLVSNRWLNGSNLWMHYMAQQGFVVFTIDNRGSANRGLNFENATHRQLGTLEMADQMRGVEFLRSLKYVDQSRMGVHGWSFGGFMTTSLMTRQAGTFKVGVAGGPVIDWSMYEIMYTERYMDRPEENPEGYKNNNLLNYTDKLRGKLMLIHGTSDDVVLWQHSLLYIQKCVKEGVQLDYFVYPEHPHNVRGKDREHLMQKVSDYLMDNLK